MTDDFERLLRSQTLAEPGAALDARVMGVLRGRRWTDRVSWKFPAIGGAVLALAAAVVVVGAVGWGEEGETVEPASMQKLVEAEGVEDVEAQESTGIVIQRAWSAGAEEGGVVQLASGEPALAVLETRVHHVEWVDPEGDARMEWIVPEERYVYVPVSYQ